MVISTTRAVGNPSGLHDGRAGTRTQDFTDVNHEPEFANFDHGAEPQQ